MKFIKKDLKESVALLSKCLIVLLGPLVGCAYFPSLTLESSSKKDNIFLIEHALHLNLPATITTPNECLETDIILDRLYDEGLKKGEYHKAFEIIMEGIEKSPTSFELQTAFAMVLGDFSSHFVNPLKITMIENSKEIFNKLFSEAQEKPKNIYYWFMNEYFYRFERFKEQYELGTLRVHENHNNTGFKGYYYQGVGAANYAKKLLLQGNPHAYEYAQISLMAWAQYFTRTNDYYNAYVHYSIALAVLGFTCEALRALERGAELIQKDHIEFQEVRDFIVLMQSNNLCANNNAHNNS